ncbi:hypothetical protein CBS101457_003476 [Exobasidium rhododendri]|nr:hypothetical protein CBS101457_003476 [Exobasidium rhododendri]
MSRSEWRSSSSRKVLVQFDDRGTPNDTNQAIIRPTGYFEELVSSQGTSSSHAFAALQLPSQPARNSQKKRAYLIVPIVAPLKDQSNDFHTNDSDNEVPSITLPSSFRRYFDRRMLFDGSDLKLSLKSHTPVSLTNVYLAATSIAAFNYAQQSQKEMEAALDRRLMRQDDIVDINGQAFRILMTEPVLQGLFLAGETHALITLDKGSSTQADIVEAQVQIEGNENDFVIDERFLANSVLDDFASDNGEEVESRTEGGEAALFEAISVLDRPAFDKALQSSRQRLALTENDLDEENSILLDESGLATLGAFEGDWAIAEIRGVGLPRVVKMFSASLQSKLSHSALPKVHLSPLLVQNLIGNHSFDSTKKSINLSLRVLRQNQESKVSSSTSGNAIDCPLPIPFADSLTIARVAGPFSMNRRYQSLFLGALRSHFEGRRRVIREGDVIAVGFDMGKARWLGGENSEGEEEEKEMDIEVIGLSLPPSTNEMPTNTAMVQFCITNLTPELTEPETEEDAGKGIDEIYFREQARTGELGCVVDTTLTKMVQTGVSRMRVADSSGWLGIETDTPTFPTQSPLTAPNSIFDKLSRLVEATLLPHAADYGLHLTVLLKGARGSGKKTLTRWVAQQAGIHLIELNCFDLIADTDTRTEGVLRARFEQAASCAPVILLLQNVDALARKSQALETGQEPMMASVLQDCINGLQQESSSTTDLALPLIVVGTTSNADKCPTGVLGCFKHEMNIEAPNEAERYAMLMSCLQDSTISVDVHVHNLATQTAALVASDLVDLVSRAQMACVERVQSLVEVDDDRLLSAGVALTGRDFEDALSRARLNYSENIGAPKIPNVTWDDVGGLVSVKDDILDTIQLPLEHPELFTDGLKKRSGILLYGPPGTGKTLLAKAVATSCSLNFFSIKGPELLNMYIGESEANVRRVFQRARDAKPCVIFFDELDSIAPKRGNQGDSGGVMDRIVSQLLAELDGMSSSDGGGGEVFVIGATNRPDLLDPALLRPGRFDRMLYLSVSETHADQLNILQALTRKFTLDDDVEDLGVIANQCPFNLTGADFYALCSDAMLKSMTRKASMIDDKIRLLNARSEEERSKDDKHPYPLTTQYYLNEMAEADSLDIKVSREDFEAALRELVPSVSMQEMAHYREVQAKFSSPSDAKEGGKGKGAVEMGLNGSNGSMKMEQLQELYRQSMVLKNTGSEAVNGHVIDEERLPLDGPAAAQGDSVENVGKPEGRNGISSKNKKGKGKGRAVD